MENKLIKKNTVVNTVLLLLVVLVSMPSEAMADDIYYGASLGSIKLTKDVGSESTDSVSFTTLYARLGAKWTENISGELRVGLASSEELSNNLAFEIKRFGGVFIKAGIPVTETFDSYAIIGKTRGKLGISHGQPSVTKTDTSFGLGTEIKAFESATVNLEYMNYIDKPVYDFAGFSLGLTFDI